ncbi:carbohydrate ABC transporter permease [Oceaniglobus trochenteri]|uniref:carbohydrate ABC transporter permease n=1 Tax=Oceaniglobus trochenteri TaxID=2763260 RepID=UPI001CFFD268|nr:carbohydrate ABC transporter permease [Oceaniglobus trochenteri]
MASVFTRNKEGGGHAIRRNPYATVALLVLTFLVWIFLVFPVVWILIGSVRTSETLFSTTSFDFTLDHYKTIFRAGFGRFIANSLFVCLIAVVISTVISVMASYVFSRKRFRGKRWLFGSVILGQMFPWIILVTPLFVLFAKIGFLNSYIGLIASYVAISIPFSVYLLVGYLESVPRELDEAATMDGCTQFQTLWTIVFPVMLPGVVATATYSFLLMWTEFLFALAFLTRTNLKTMPLGLVQFFGEQNVDWGAVMAASAVTTLPALMIFLPLQSKLAGGLTAGAVKG